MEDKKQKGPRSFKEDRIRAITRLYYSLPEIRKVMFEFGQHREVVPRFYEGFGKRPDALQFESDIFQLAQKGATSFHCSEELWLDPLAIETGMPRKELNELRGGWDLLIDIDCPWIDYSKKAAKAIMMALEKKGVTNISIKFSGSKGFHILVPWKAFPKVIGDIQTGNMFPEWPRIIVEYLKEVSHPILQDLLYEIDTDFTKVEGMTGVKCENCNNLAQERYQITLMDKWSSPPYEESFRSTTSEYKEKKSPFSGKPMEEVNKKPFYYCDVCKIDSFSEPENFKEGSVAVDVFKILGLDVLLVSPRHLFRMPYSLHEKTALASVVIDKESIDDFDIRQADPMKVDIKSFIPKPQEEEAKQLLIDALDWHAAMEGDTPKGVYTTGEDTGEKSFKPLELPDAKPEDFPPAIQKILKGVRDGRKRGLFILINFMRSIGTPKEDMEKIIYEWNEKNEVPLKEGYITSQLLWAYRNKIVMPPSYDKDYYKGIGIIPEDQELRMRNPVAFMSMQAKKGKRKKSTVPKKRSTQRRSKDNFKKKQ